MTLSATRSKVHHMYTSSSHESQISLRFALQSLIFQIIEFFGFSKGYNDKLEIFEKKKLLKMGNSNSQKS